MILPWNETPTVQALLLRLAESFNPPERIKCSQWALQRRRLSGEASAKGGGRFSFEMAPWQEEVLDAPDDPEVHSVVLMWSAQDTGKTETLLNIIGYSVDIDPCPMLLLEPTIELAEAVSKDRISTMFRDTPALRNKIKDPRSRDSGNTILHKTFPGGHITLAGANSPVSLAGRPIRKLFLDEVDRYPASAGTEGDPARLAERRTSSFADAIKIETSTPTIEGISKIKKRYNVSDQRKWFVKCPHCQFEQTLEFKNVRFTFLNEAGQEETHPERACIVCGNQECGKEWTETERQAAIRAGKWIATAKFKGIRGYTINSIYCLFPARKGFKSRLHQLVAAFLEAKEEGKESLMTFTNTYLAETWLEEAEKPVDWQILFNRREPYTIPKDCFLLIAKVDVQANRLEVEIEGFGFGEESWGIELAQIFGNPHRGETWKALDDFLAKTWQHPCGQPMRISITGIDSGGVKDKKSFAVPVYRYVKAHTQASRGRGGVIAIKGSSTRGAQLSSERLQKNGVNLLLIGTDTAKSTVYDRLKLDEPGPRYMHFPESYTEEYFRQLTAEEMRISKIKGYLIKTWHKTRERNEALDLKAYGLALYDLLNVDMRAIAARFKMPESVKKEYALDPEKKMPQSQAVQPIQIPKPMRRMNPFRRRR